ncbi:hypothetical protein ASPWEDRAFT_56147 [Aspergillus wentii DTO 134E9]|uniref:Trichothecene 3-O-acetyltransferase-like N-terminal domain-containing protein n=1 Tax=Aspergillus wentii DTO 134E9 TaxID=1073089 RepID=A0A1L9S113_ASPWE|nr:uncharacterized protein ASPWEDRAFT_56147 [Aspergillus wentii DTO 134E9]OJJ40855.1 hypothetical protein ASPWEDRAFT_56147 [Aspergillus wentii DTO 134E9]
MIHDDRTHSLHTPHKILENDLLDVLGHQPSLHKLYTQICCVYPIPDPSVHDHVTNTLRTGLDRLAEAFPWLAGHVLNQGADKDITGTFRIIPSDEIPLVVKDLRRVPTAPTMDALREARYPFTMLDEQLIAPCMTINPPGTAIGLVGDTGPVFAVQANFIDGGLILTFAGQHNTMDMTGQASIINLLSKTCSTQPFSEEELSIGNMDKSKIIPLLDDDWQPGSQLDHQMAKPLPQNTQPRSKSTWGYVTFSAASLEALKSQAIQTKDPQTDFISTDDTVSAFIWKCLSRVRACRLEPKTPSTFARAIDARRYMGVPATYPGALSNMTYNTDSIDSLAQQPLGIIASNLRKELDQDLAYKTRALATFLHRCTDKAKILITASVDPSAGIMLSSWAKVNLYDLGFSLGFGRPETVRRPVFVPVESLMYIMPRSPEGELAVALCVRDEDWERLEVDEEWTRYARYVG